MFPLSDGGEYIALKGINLTIKEGEFVSFIGHSGCGKSTLLDMIAGFSQPTAGLVTLEGKKILEPGPDRMVVFQNYSLLPWQTVRENIALAVDTVMSDRTRADRHDIVDRTPENGGPAGSRRQTARPALGRDEAAGSDRPRPGHSPQAAAAR